MTREPVDAHDAIGRAAREMPEAPEDRAFAARVIATAAATRRGKPEAVEIFPLHRMVLHAAAGFAVAAALILGAFLAQASGASTPAYAVDPLELAFAGGGGR